MNSNNVGIVTKQIKGCCERICEICDDLKMVGDGDIINILEEQIACQLIDMQTLVLKVTAIATDGVQSANRE